MCRKYDKMKKKRNKNEQTKKENKWGEMRQCDKRD